MGWQVVDQQPAAGPGPTGTFTPGVDVHYQLDGGKQFVVFVPAAVYAQGPEAVKAVIAAQAATAEAVAGLSG